jgi:5-aminopentanamidase
MKVAAYQIPLTACRSLDAIPRIAAKVRWCEAHGVDALCCPEGVLGGLADYARIPADIAMSAEDGQLHAALVPLASNLVTTILGFTERGVDGRLYNSAAILHQGAVLGVYRKLYPAINRSVYSPGNQTPVFRLSNITFGILLCRDSLFSEPASAMAAEGASVLFVPTNSGLPPGKAGPELVSETRACDSKRAVENSAYVVRADVTGQDSYLVSFGMSSVTGPDGRLIEAANQDAEELISMPQVVDVP